MKHFENKIMTIPFQKIIRWIPIINLSTVVYTLFFLWKKGKMLPVAPFVKMAVLAALIAVPEMLIQHFLDVVWLESLIYYVVSYFQMFVFSSFGIWVQEDILKNHE